MEVFGEVVRSIRLEEKGEKNYQLGIEFLDLNAHDRDGIITAVFQYQRQTIRINKSMDLDPIWWNVQEIIYTASESGWSSEEGGGIWHREEDQV